jgi:DNA polymerase III delta subunit
MNGSKTDPPKTAPSQVSPQVYLLYGDDTVGKDTARARALRAIHGTHPGAIVEHFDDALQPFTEYIDKMLMPTLFGDIRIFIVSRAETLTEKELGQLNAIIKAPPDDIYVLIDIGVTGGRKKTGSDPSRTLHIATLAKDTTGRYFCRLFEKPPEYKVARWLIDNVQELCGRSIGQQEAELLVDFAGHDIATLYSELQKIDVYLDEGEPVTAGAIRQIVGSSRQMSVFELAGACGTRSAVRVLEILDSLFAVTFSAPMMLSVLYRHYSALYRLRQYAIKAPQDIKLLLKSSGGFQAKNDAAFRAGCAAGLLHKGEERKVYPVIIASGIVAQAQRYTDRELMTVMSWLLDFDVAVKTGRASGSRHEVELFCYRLLRVSELLAAGATAW